MRIIFFLLFFVSLPTLTWAYPAFVSYGYKSCVTCHFNGQGNGPLNDYGRALFAAEIASRALYDPKTTPEELAERSGFLGKTELPWWVRPGFKFRGLWFQSDPGSDRTQTRAFPMQADANLAILLDPAQKLILVGSMGYMPTPRALQNSNVSQLEQPTNYLSREHYIRWNPSKNWFLYAGLMDKVFGIRTIDHTSFGRLKTGLAQNDQSHGLMITYMPQDWEITLNPFFGHMGQAAELRQKGFSVMVEKDLAEKHRVGGAVLSSQNEYIQWSRAEIHSKYGFGFGNSFLSEFGVIRDTPKNGEAQNGSYFMIESLALLTRGYNFLSQLEYYNQTMSSKSPDLIRWTFGLLMFPAPKYELRTTLVNGRTQSDSGVSADQWQMQVQFHMAL